MNFHMQNDGPLLHLAVDHGYCNLFDVLCSHLTKTDVNAQDKVVHYVCYIWEVNEDSVLRI